MSSSVQGVLPPENSNRETNDVDLPMHHHDEEEPTSKIKQTVGKMQDWLRNLWNKQPQPIYLPTENTTPSNNN